MSVTRLQFTPKRLLKQTILQSNSRFVFSIKRSGYINIPRLTKKLSSILPLMSCYVKR